MQTFLPYADFLDSARVLDPARLGKQRVEALQVLRAIVFPTYGWQNHPAVQMWRGFVPALTRYSLDMVDVWTALGHTDTTRPLLVEFAAEVDGTPIGALPTPSWLGDEEFHLSHRSNLVRKAPEFYGPLFPGVPDDLPYVWPGADAVTVSVSSRQLTPDQLPLELPAPGASPLWILRPRHADELDEWLAAGGVTLAEVSPRGKRSRGWQAQLDQFSALDSGAELAVLVGDGSRLLRGTITGDVAAYRRDDGEMGLRRAVRFRGELTRATFPYPAVLQDPRTLFEVAGPSE